MAEFEPALEKAKSCLEEFRQQIEDGDEEREELYNKLKAKIDYGEAMKELTRSLYGISRAAERSGAYSLPGPACFPITVNAPSYHTGPVPKRER
jgi:hypothetical protein